MRSMICYILGWVIALLIFSAGVKVGALSRPIDDGHDNDKTKDGGDE